MQSSPSVNRRVAVLGVGSMGTAIARTLAQAGHHVGVWNRSKDRVAGLQGVWVAETAAEACASAEMTFVCLSDFNAVYDVLKQRGAIEALNGKPLVHMSTATPDQVKEFQRFSSSNGINYIDAKIAVTPAQIGAAKAVIFFAGPREIFARIETVVSALAGRATFMGERIDAAVQGDFAFLSVYFAGTIGVLHGAAFSKMSGLDVEQFFGLIPCFLDEIHARSKSFERMIMANDYSHVQSALKTDLAGARLLANAAIQIGMDDRFANALIALMQDAVTQGHGELDSAAMVKGFSNGA